MRIMNYYRYFYVSLILTIFLSPLLVHLLLNFNLNLTHLAEGHSTVGCLLAETDIPPEGYDFHKRPADVILLNPANLDEEALDSLDLPTLEAMRDREIRNLEALREPIMRLQDYPFPREQLIEKIRILIDEIQLLKGLKDISKGYIYNALTERYIDARTPESVQFDQELIWVGNNAPYFCLHDLKITYYELLKIKGGIR